MTRSSLGPRRFCVIVHDVTPVFARQIDTIVRHIQPEVPEALACAAVPRWHGALPGTGDRGCWRRWSAAFAEKLLHGWTHCRDHRPGIVSWVTGRADEFAGRALSDVIDRIRRGRLMLEDAVEQRVCGLVPPAWQLTGSLGDLRGSGMEFVVRLGRLESAVGANVLLATYSWDWGRLSLLSRAGACLGSCVRFCNRRAIPVVVVHPADVARGHLPRALRLIRQLKSKGWLPSRIADLVAAETRPIVS